MTLTANPVLRASLRGLTAWCVLAVLGLVFAPAITRTLLPMMEAAVDLLQSDFSAYLALTDSNRGPQLMMSCTVNHDVVLPSGARIPYLGTYACASTDALHALAPIVIFLSLLIAWPAADRREIVKRIVAAAWLLPLVVALTTPPLLVGVVESKLHADTFAAGAQLTALLQPFVFMEMGGSWLCPLLAASVCLRVSAWRRRAPAAPAWLPDSPA
jgi:hypothetical protein